MTTTPRSPSSRLPLAISMVAVVGLVVVVLLWVLRKDDESSAEGAGEGGAPSKSGAAERDTSGQSPDGPAEPADPGANDNATPPVPAPVIEPAEKPITGNVTREVIAGVRTSGEAAQVHRILTAQLFDRLEELAQTTDRERVRVAIQEIADRFYLLDRVVSVNKLKAPGAASLDEGERERIAALHAVWQANLDLSLTVDLLFSQRGLLVDEHVPQMFRRWMETSPADEDGEEDNGGARD